ncbi:FliO/MopB family protein [Mesoaciditoga lauensis]|uniref:FliO/MopB family protein n=1 Tax=Mesoaciditoga lauensis TaxID=1495039 RepID=UPI00055E54FF|nr:flagellar biosynthetic protein FliO [Mesoaciditoga lauensis]
MASATPTSSFGSASLTFLISTIIIIAVLLFVLYVVRKFGVKHLKSKYMKVLDVLPLGKSTVIYLVELKNRYFFVACTPSNTQVLMELKDEDDIKDIEIGESDEGFSRVLFSKLGKRFLKDQIDRIDELK